ncbi:MULTISPECIES: MFS transporter [unclassified Microbacterium]|uniref:MFS transporter n=1 Tax=unclassified Microbacterium TaxID=2609290 RepID=UPI00386D5047
MPVSPPRIVAVAIVYGLQGLGYAVLVTALPLFQGRSGLDGTALSLILLGVCLTAAAGSIVADAIARRAGSRLGVRVGLGVQALALVGAALAPDTIVFVATVLLYGLGLGLIDAASNMQGVLVQRGRALPLLGRFYASYTVGAIVGALTMAAVIAAGIGGVTALIGAAALQIGFILTGSRLLTPERAALPPRQGPRPRLDRRAITMAGLVVLAAFTIDSAVSSWSAVHLSAIGAAAALAPVGYAIYQAAVLGARLAFDPLARRAGRARVLGGALAVGAAGGILVAAVPLPAAAFAGFALSGLAVGVLVPLAFGMAGAIDPVRSDEVIARVNLFNYAGAVLGAVAVGVMLDVTGPGLAFLLPALLLAVALPALREARRTTAR